MDATAMSFEAAGKVALRALVIAMLLGTTDGNAQGFRWVNSMPEGAHPGLEHGTYYSDVMELDAGYAVYLPPGYEDPEQAEESYPVVYFLAGGRVGSEVKGIPLAAPVDEWIRSGAIWPRIFVFVNGGPEGYFDYGDSQAETSFVQELIPHIDRTYRTIENGRGRALEGFSMGARASARIAFKHPELFCSAAALSGGHQKEKAMSESGGEEVRGSKVLVHSPTNNSWDLATAFAERSPMPDLEIMVAVGSTDMNYQANLDWMEHLRTLDIPFEEQIPPGVPHDLRRLLGALGPSVEAFHDRCFAAASTGEPSPDL
jgi:endo-1,4-beta-xylanase